MQGGGTRIERDAVDLHHALGHDHTTSPGPRFQTCGFARPAPGRGGLTLLEPSDHSHRHTHPRGVASMASDVGLGGRTAFATVAASLMFALPLASAADRERVIVAFKTGSAATVRAEALRQGGRIHVDLTDLDAFAVTLPKVAIARLASHPAVEYVEADPVRTIQGARARRADPAVTPAVTAGVQTVPYGITLTQSDQVTGTPVWTPRICIVDSGIFAGHEDLAGNVMSGKNHTRSGTWDSDENTHGTHVAGTIAALDNTLGVVGVNGNKQVSLYIAKVFDAAGSASSSTISSAISGCTRARANVISMSLGGSSATRTERRAVDAAHAKGILLVAAAGNGGNTAISYPAGFANVMSVAAVDAGKNWASFSQFNADVEIAAPGVAVESTIPPNIESRASASVGSTAYTVQAMAGSPRLSATGPLADFGFGDAPSAGSMAGKVCLISRGNISFADKVLNCQNSGGIGAIVYNNIAGDLFGTLGTTVTTIPSVGALQADGTTMLTQLGQSATVTVEADPSLYASFNGTSMATPHVSGIAALVWSYYPSCTAEQIRTSLKLSAQDIGDPGRDDKTGAGLVQARAAFDRIASQGCGN
ncbi:MAG TPA: S8 family serine peptidase [Burkholderiaceae bacterium]|nr:S8 family serine peptidase [Burkholderiaceae bacterium]